MSVSRESSLWQHWPAAQQWDWPRWALMRRMQYWKVVRSRLSHVRMSVTASLLGLSLASPGMR